MQICYRDVNAKRTERQIWPFALGFREAGPVIVAWCELRHAFRYFRVDRVESTLFEEERYPDRPDALRRRWSIEASAQHDRYVAACSVVPDTVQPTKS
jgi:predicted DNA-binding transcriptional regulator YafY